MGNKINFEVGLNLNQSQYNQIKSQLNELQRMTATELMKQNPSLSSLTDAQKQLQAIKHTAGEVQGALNKAFNTNLGTLNISKFNSSLKELNLDRIYKDFQSAGNAGQNAFRNISNQILTTNIHLKETHKFLDSMATTLANTAKWGIASSALNNMTGAVQKAWTFTKQLDTSLNNIRIVTSKSADEMERFAKVANKTAQTLGKSTKDYTDAALIFYQQGLNDVESQQRAEITLKTANVTGQSTDDVSEQLTAVWNGYKVATKDAEMYVDKLAAVAADTAADLEELSTGMSKVASAANIMGVDIDQLSATLATVISVTRQAPESVGTAFKTIYARMGDIKAGIDEETTLDAYTQQMKDVGGINVLDANNELRDMGEVIEEVGEKWSSMTREQQVALSQVMAGTRQYNNLLALFDNWGMYTDALETSKGSLGELNRENEIYLESTAAHLEQLSAAWERIFDALVDNKGVNSFIDGLTGATNLLGNFVEMLGGGGNSLLLLGSIGTKVFSKQIAGGIATAVVNFQNAKDNAKTLRAELAILEQFKGIQQLDSVTAKLVQMKQEALELNEVLTDTDRNTVNAYINKRNDLENESVAWEEQKTTAQNTYQQLTGREINITGINANSDEYKTIIKELDDLDAQYKNVKQGAADFAKELQKAAMASDDFNDDDNEANLRKYFKALNAVSLSMDGYLEDTQAIIDKEQVSAETIIKLTQAVENYKKVRDKSSEGEYALADDPETQEAAQNLVNAYMEAGIEIRNGAAQTRQTVTQESRGATENVVNNINTVESEYNQLIAKLRQKQTITGFVELASGVGQFASAVSTVINLGNIIKDDDITNGEKLLQIMMGLPTAIGLFSGAIKTMHGGLAKLAVGLAATKVGTDATKVGFWQATTAVLGFQTALGPLWAILLAVIAVVGVAVGVFVAWSNANNASAESAKQAAAAVEEMKTQLEEATTAAEELKKSIDSLEDSYSAIDGLREGTEEYNEAIKNANEQAKALIETLELLPNQYEYDGRGVITFKPGVLDDAQEEADRKVKDKEANVYIAEMVSNDADLTYQSDKLAEKIGMVSSVNGIYQEGSYWSDGGWGQRELSPETIDGIINGLVDTDAIIQRFGRELSLLSDEELKQAILAIDGLTPAAKQMVDSIVREREGLEDLVVATQEATNANLLYAKELSRLIIEEKYGDKIRKFNTNENGIVDEQKSNLMTTILTNASDENTKKINNKVNDYSDTINKIDSNSKLGDFLWNTLGQIKGIDWSGDDDEALALEYARSVKGATGHLTYTRDDGGFGRGSVTDSQGNKIVDQMDDNAMRKGIAEHYAKEYIKQNMSGDFNLDELETTLEGMVTKATQFGEQYGTDFSTAMLAAIANKSGQFDFSGLFAEIDPNEHDELMKLSGEELMAKFGIDEKLMQEGGWKSATEFKESFQKAFEEWDWNINDAVDAAMEKKSNQLEDVSDGNTKKKLEEASEEVKVYAKNLMQVAKNGKEVSKELEFDADTATEFAFKVIKMNKAIDTLADNFKDWKDIIKNSTEYSEEYAEAMYGMRDALADVYDTSMDYISNDFVAEHLSEIERIAKGDEQAIDSLRKELGEEIVANIVVENRLEAQKDEILAEYSTLYDMIQDRIKEVKIGAPPIDDAALIQSLNDMITQCGLTVEQANAVFSQMGIEPTYETTTVKQEQSNPIIQTETQTHETEPTEMEYVNAEGNTVKAKVPNFIQVQRSKTIGYETATVDVPVTALAMNGKQPTITGIKKAPTAVTNNYSSKNKGGGGPGKSSGGSKSKPNKMDKVDKTPDRYHKVDTQLTKIGNQLNKIQSQEKKFIGAELIANINGQLDELDDRLDRLREKQQIAYGEADELRKKLTGEGVKFNDDGTIANYMEIYNAKVQYVNDLIEKYNAMSVEEQEKYKDTVEQAKDDLDKFLEDLDRYDEVVSDLIPGLSNEIQDAIDQEIELNIKKFNLEFDVRLNMKDATKDWNEFKKRILDGIDEDDIYGNAKARATDDFSNMIGENGVQASTKQAQEVLAELKEMDATGWSDVYGDDRAKALEDLKTAYETINEDLMEIDQIQKDVYQAWLDTMDEINDKMADQVAMYEQVSNLIDHDMKVIQLIYGETDYEALGKYYDKQHQNNLGLLDFQRQNADFWEKEMNSIDKEKDPDAWKKARDNWISAVNDLNATVEASIENARDKMENTIDDTFQKFNNEITDGKGLDYLAQQWDLVNDNADDYLDTVNAAFGIRQLENKYQDAIDLTDNISAQRKLNDLMESELKALREKDKLTEYDIERANMKYEIALKQIALEEAQQTKTTMRLRRDSQGNYRYEYIADEDAIGKLQDELDVLENSLYNFDKERWIEMQNQVVDAVQERQDAIKEIMMDASLSEEERAERLAEINRLYNEKIQNITDQTVTAQNNLYQSGADELAKIWEAEGKDFQSLSNEEQRILTEEMLPQFETGVNDMITKFSGPGGFEDMTVGSMENLKKATDEYNDELDEIEYNAGVSFDKVEEGIDKNIPKTEQLIEDNDTLNQEYQEQIDKIKELNLKLQEQADKYKKIAEEAKKATQEAYNYWMEQQRQAAEAAEQEKKNSDGVQNPNEGNKNDNNPTNGGNKNPTGKTTLSASDAIGVAAAISLADNYGGWGTGATRSKRLAEKFTNDNDVQDVINRNGGYKNLKGEYNAYKNKLGDYYYSKFDTGGYTGDWAGNYGKFAMLHSKELVLNAHDTDNMLNMMQIARDVIALAGPRVGALSAGKGAGAAAGQLEQNVHIEANFPNVESASEIEEALNNLVQLASQRATRNTRG